MEKTEYIAFRATPTEKLALEQLAERTEGNKSVVLRELVLKEAVACGVLAEEKETPQRESRGAVEVGNEE